MLNGVECKCFVEGGWAVYCIVIVALILSNKLCQASRDIELGARIMSSNSSN